MNYVWTNRHIKRAELRANPQLTYLYGDNSIHSGIGGMARECRGEPNAVGIPTKWRPAMTLDAFFRDTDGLPTSLVAVAPRALIESAILEAESRGLPIVVPVGLGQGLAQMPHHCPMLYRWMCERLHRDPRP